MRIGRTLSPNRLHYAYEFRWNFLSTPSCYSPQPTTKALVVVVYSQLSGVCVANLKIFAVSREISLAWILHLTTNFSDNVPVFQEHLPFAMTHRSSVLLYCCCLFVRHKWCRIQSERGNFKFHFKKYSGHVAISCEAWGGGGERESAKKSLKRLFSLDQKYEDSQNTPCNCLITIYLLNHSQLILIHNVISHKP